MIFPANHTLPQAAASTAEEAERRLLDLLREYAEMPRAAKPDTPGMVNVMGQIASTR